MKVFASLTLQTLQNRTPNYYHLILGFLINKGYFLDMEIFCDFVMINDCLDYLKYLKLLFNSIFKTNPLCLKGEGLTWAILLNYFFPWFSAYNCIRD